MADVFDFSSFINDRSARFTGRGWLFDEIDRWLADPGGTTFFLLIGPPGSGKSAIAARFLQTHTEVAAHHFCIARDAATIDPALFVRSLSRQLCRQSGFAEALLKDTNVDIKAVVDVQRSYGDVIGVKIENLVVNSPSAVVAFVHAFVEPLKALYRDGAGTPLVIVVDGLDEAVQHLGRETIVGLLANAGEFPRQVRWLLTSRNDAAVLNGFETRRVTTLVLGEQRREANAGDVREFVLEEIRSSPDAAKLQANLAERHLTSETLADRVASASAGNFLYVVWLLKSIANDARRLDALEQLPDGLDGIYREFLRTRRLGDDKRAWRSSYRPVLGVLAVARSELTVAQVTNLAELSGQEAADALSDLQQFLDPVFAQGRCHIYHKSVIDFLADQGRAQEFWVSLPDAHRQVVDHYRGKAEDVSGIEWPRVDDYGLLHLASHLYALDGDRSELYRLISRTYLFEKRRRFGSDRAFIADLGLALDAAAAEPRPNLVQEVRLSLIQGTLGTAASEVPAEALGALAWSGETARALDYIAIMQEDWRRVMGYELVCEALLAQGQSEQAAAESRRAIEIVSKMNDERGRGRWLGRVIPAAVRTGQAPRIHEIISDIHDAQSVLDALLELTAAQVAAGARSDVDDVVERLQGKLPEAPDDNLKARIFAALSRMHLSLGRSNEARQAAEQALAAFRRITGRARQSVAFAVGPALVAAGMRDDALALSEAIPKSSEQRVFFLTRLVDTSIPVGDREQAAGMARDALDVVRTLSASALSRAIPRLIGALVRTGLVDDARRLVRRADDRGAANEALARALAKEGDFDAALDILEDAENQAAAADALEDVPLERATPAALERALRLWPPTDTTARVELAGRLALALARRGDKERARALIDRALVDAASDVDNESMGRTLGSIATALASDGPNDRSGAVAERALALLCGMENDAALGRVLPDLIPVLVANGRAAAAREALKGVEDLGDRGRAEGTLAKTLYAAGEHDESLRLAVAIEDPYARVWPLRELAETCARAGDFTRAARAAKQALAAARSLDRDDAFHRNETLRAAAAALAWAGDGKAARVAIKEIDDDDERASALAELREIGGARRARPRPVESSEPAGVPQDVDADDVSQLSGGALDLFAAGQTAEAIELAKRALSIAVANAPTITQLGGRRTTWTTNPALPLIDVARSSLRAGLLDQLVSAASILSDLSSRAEALAGIAAAVHDEGEQSRAIDIWREALKPARVDSRWKVLGTLDDGAALLYDIDAGQTLWSISEALREIEEWWVSREPVTSG